MSKRHNDAKALITRVVVVQEIIAYTSSGFQKPNIDCANQDIGPRNFIIALRIIFFMDIHPWALRGLSVQWAVLNRFIRWGANGQLIANRVCNAVFDKRHRH